MVELIGWEQEEHCLGICIYIYICSTTCHDFECRLSCWYNWRFAWA